MNGFNIIKKTFVYPHQCYSTSASGAKQTTEPNNSNCYIVKNPNWLKGNQLAVYKRGRGFELGATEKQIQVVVRAGLQPRKR